MKRLITVRARGGFSLVEVLVAMVLLSVVLMALAPVLFHSVNQQRLDARRLERSGILMAETNELLATPFAQLPATDGQWTATEPFPHTVRVEVQDTAGGRKLTVIVVPDDDAVGAEEIVLYRAGS